MSYEPRDPYEVHWTIAEDLIGDGDIVGRPRALRLGGLHLRILSVDGSGLQADCRLWILLLLGFPAHEVRAREAHSLAEPHNTWSEAVSVRCSR